MADGNGQYPEGTIRGRFALVPAEGASGAMLYWALALCDRCQDCKCGNQKPALDLTPAGSMKTFLQIRQWQKDGIPR